MSEPKLISPLLDNFLIGDPISDHNGIRCCPAMNSETSEKYIVKIISLPPSATQLDALMLTGAIKDEEDAKRYYAERAMDWVAELKTLQQLSKQEGFISCENFQVVPAEDGIGCEIYVLTPYKRTLARQLKKKPFTQLDALNLALDICSALSACRRNGYLFTNLKPGNIFLTENGEFKIGDLGFLSLSGLQYAAIADHCLSEYTAPEVADAFSFVNETVDVYSLGMVLYGIFNGGDLPEDRSETLPAPKYADSEIAQIILKACDPNPEERWADPAQMGQMFVSYMQKNGAFDVPIVPPAPVEDPVIEEPIAETENTEESDNIEPIIAVDEMLCEDITLPTGEDAVEPEVEDAPEEVLPVESDAETGNEEILAEAEESEAVEDDKSEAAVEEMPVVILPLADEPEIADPVEEQINSTEESITADPQDEPIDPETLDDSNDSYDEIDEIKAAAAYLLMNDSDENLEELSYDDISDEVSQILSQADALANMEVPEPVVAPDAVEITLPQPEFAEDDTDDGVDDSDETEDDTEILEEDYIMKDNHAESAEKPLRRPHWIRTSIIIALLLLLIAGGFLFFKLYVLETVDQLELTGTNDSLVVKVSSTADESLLSVTCEDKYGAKITVPVHEGVAEFTGLRPELTYTVRVKASGLHVLTGETTDTHTTPEETSLLQYNVITGNEIGTVVLNFTIDGPTCENWTFTYATDGYEEQVKTFTGESLTISELLPDKLYTGILAPEEDLFVTKPIEVTFSATELVQAHDLKITACANGKLTVQWNAPENIQVDSWNVRCYSGTDGASYDQAYTTSETSYEFQGLNSADSFTVEVTAAGQTIVQKTSIGENSVTISNFMLDSYQNGSASLSWSSETTPENGWVVLYSVDNSEPIIAAEVMENTAVVNGLIPNAEYSFTIQSADSVHTFCDPISLTTDATDDFTITINNKKIVTDDFEFSMFRHPDKEGWIRYDITNAHYTNVFTLEQEAGFVGFLDKKYDESNIEFYATIVIKDDQGQIIDLVCHTGTWKSVWKDNYYVFTLPKLPDEAGFYTATVYFNSQFVEEQAFTIQ